MKYMTFNSSCSYAGLANLLSFCGIDTEDREIAIRMRLPYLFAYEKGSYLSGPMLQGAEWFNLYLRPLGFILLENRLDKAEVCGHLRANSPAMLGLRVSPESKHAVIYIGHQDGKFQFLNNKQKDSPEPETLRLSEEELLARLDGSVVTGHLERIYPVSVCYRPYLEDSLLVFRDLREAIAAFCGQEQSADTLRQAMNRLFRPLLLDGVTMLELLDQTEAASALKEVRAQFLDIVRAERPTVLEKKLDMNNLNIAAAQYEKMIAERIKME